MTDTDHAFSRALEAHRRGDLAAAESGYAAVLAADDAHPDALNGLAGLRLQQGRADEGVALMQRAVQAAPENATLWTNLGRCAMAAARPDLAESAARRACDIEPGNADHQLLRGNALRALDRIADAHAAYLAAATAAPDMFQAHYALAMSEMAIGEPRAAEWRLRKWREWMPQRVEIHNALGNAIAAQGRLPEALAAYGDAIRLDRGFVLAYVNYGLTALELGRLDEASEALDRALQRHPGEQSAVSARAVLAVRRGEHALASQLLGLDRIVQLGDLPVPAGYATRDDWHRALRAEVLDDPTLLQDPASKTTRMGRQSAGLAAHTDGALGAFVQALRDALPARLAQARMPPAPYAKPAPTQWQLHVWATVLDTGGRQDPHLHPAGWLSGVYYVDVPAGEGEDGWIEFGDAPDALRGDATMPTRRVQPREGLLATFPSYLYHRTVPHTGGSVRISLAFDVLPA